MSIEKGQLPQQVNGIIFTEILPPLLQPEIDVKSLIRLGAIVRQENRSQTYAPLTDTCRKIQWAKLSGLNAIRIEREFAKEMLPGVLVNDVVAQMEHAMSITSFIVHTKSALDSLSVFLTKFFDLGFEGGQRDFKLAVFRQAIVASDPIIGRTISALGPWFEQVQRIRDEWIHVSSPRTFLVIGRSPVGRLPIPRDITPGLNPLSLDVTENHFISTVLFVEQNYANLADLFSLIVERSIDFELQHISSELPVPPEVEAQLSMFPMRAIESVNLTKMRVGERTLNFLRGLRA